MPTSRGGRRAACTYLLLVLGAISTWLVAAHQQGAVDGALVGGFWVAMVLTLPTGLLAYGLVIVSLAATAPPDGGPSLGGALLVLVFFLGAAFANVVMVGRAWRDVVDRRTRSSEIGVSNSPEARSAATHQAGRARHMRRPRPDRISFGDVARFVVNTRRGRFTAVAYLGTAVLLGLVLGVSRAPQAVVSIVVVVYVLIAIPIIFGQVRRAGRPPDGSRW